MKLQKEDYKRAVGILKRYNYNCIAILNTRADILSLSVATNDGMPKTKYNINDSVCDKLIELEENEELQQSIREYKIVRQVLELVNNDCKQIFEDLYQKGKTKWQIVSEGMSERTFERRKSELIYTVHKELKKSWRKIGGIFIKNVLK